MVSLSPAVIRTGWVMPARRFSRAGSGIPHSVMASYWASRTSSPLGLSRSGRAVNRFRYSRPFCRLVSVISKNRFSRSSGPLSSALAMAATSLIQPCISCPPCGPVPASTSRLTSWGRSRVSSWAIIPPME